jgi:NAD(P)-dependent dehydrogenase (short-subunit alcohol dehydrogenase family)
MKFENKVALVTGGSSGIGYAAAEKLASEGASVGLLSRTEEETIQAAQRLSDKGYDVMPLIADISKVDDMQRAVQTMIDQWGKLNMVFANAGINGTWTAIDELEVEEWDQTIAVNLRGTFLTVKYAVPHLKKQGGAVVITASINGTRTFSNTGATAYATTKAGQVAFAKMLALELAPHKIRVNVICPGMIDTEIDENTKREDLEDIRYPVEFPQGLVPLTGGKAGTSAQVADLVAFLCSEQASLITGTETWIDGAQSLLMG